MPIGRDKPVDTTRAQLRTNDVSPSTPNAGAATATNAPTSSSADAGHDLDEIRKAVALINGGMTPAEVEQSRRITVRSTESAFTPPWNGYSWDPATLDAVMKRTGVADAKAVIQTAIAMDQSGRYLNADTLLDAARARAAPLLSGVKWSPSTLADIMQQTGIAEETALLRMAKRVDRGDKFLDEDDLLRAANILKSVVDAHDFVAITERVNALRGRDDLSVETIGKTEGGLPVDVVRFPSATQPPALTVFVSGGVHGDEPCGAGAALLLIEQLAANPQMRGMIEWVVVPVANPRALVSGTREIPESRVDSAGAAATTIPKRDMNREMKPDEHDPLEADFMQQILGDTQDHLAIDLHSGAASRNGFWAIQQNARGDDDAIAPAAMRSFGTEWPLLNGDVTKYDLVEPGVVTSENAGTVKGHAIESGARWAVTVEAPGSVSYREQVLGQNDIVHQHVLAALARIAAEGRP